MLHTHARRLIKASWLTLSITAPLQAAEQQVTPTPSDQVVTAGQLATVSLAYQTDPCDSTLTGLGLRLHWDSTRLSLQRISGLLSDGFIGQGAEEADSEDLDSDPSTDRRLVLGWADIDAAWPGGGCESTELLQAEFAVADPFAGAARVNFTASATASGYNFVADSAWLTRVARPDRGSSEWKITEIYVATMGYAPDSEGLDYWVGQIATQAQWTPTTVAQSFFDQPLVQSQYPADQSNEGLIAALYQNLFARLPDEAGAAYWMTELESGRVQRNEMIVALIEGGWDNVEAANDMARFGHQIEVGLAFAEAQRERGILYSALTESQQVQLRQAGELIISDVTADPDSVETAIAAISGLLDTL